MGTIVFTRVIKVIHRGNSRTLCNSISACDFAGTILKLANGMPAFFSESPQTEAVYKMISVSQPAPAPETIAKMYRPTSKVDKAQINSRLAKTL